jgi:hypothetical protein
MCRKEPFETLSEDPETSALGARAILFHLPRSLMVLRGEPECSPRAVRRQRSGLLCLAEA